MTTAGVAGEAMSKQKAAPAFHSITPVRAYEGVVSQIEEAIFSGVLEPGHRLPSEREMMAQFGVSRSTVREALRVLESNGLVRSRPGDPNGGAEIQPSSPDHVSKALTSFARLGRVGVAELVEFRMVVEGSAVHLAANLHTQEELDAMNAAFAEMQLQAEISYEAFSKADVKFHLTIARFSRNALLGACSEFAHDMVLKLTTDKLRDSPDPQPLMEHVLARHGAYLEAIGERNGRRAEALARRDLFDWYGEYLSSDERQRLELLLWD